MGFRCSRLRGDMCHFSCGLGGLRDFWGSGRRLFLSARCGPSSVRNLVGACWLALVPVFENWLVLVGVGAPTVDAVGRLVL